jgi:hypothetical protein
VCISQREESITGSKGKEEPSLSDEVKMRRRDEGDRRFNAGPI